LIRTASQGWRAGAEAMHYLLKTEPSEYSFADLVKDSPTVWDGVKNPAAVKNLREMRPGDGLIIYHTGSERRAVGRAEVVSVDAVDPKSPRVMIRAGKLLAKPVTLEEMKSRKIFASSPLIRMGRLSVVQLTSEQFQFLLGK
jgi:predicted RNA-binding protein with PUA-like domain